ncbi:MAG: hypothetical protein QNL04_01290 [SAR324 cluster bacterium]|nr:hypothetical protein [SAR324 cluster bacterium]
MKKILLLALCFFSFLTPAVFGAIEGKGRAEIFNGNESSARKQAMNNALRDAVEKGVGLLLDAKTEVKNWQVIKDEVYSSATGYVTKYKSLRNERVGNVWFVEIEAEVAQGKLKDKLGNLRILHKKMGNKRLMVIYKPTHPQAQAADHPAALASLAVIQMALTGYGFRLFDQKALDRIYDPSRASDAWIRVAQEQQVDILVEFEVVATGRNQPGQMFQAAKAQVLTRVYDVSTARLISNQMANQKQITKGRVGSFDWTTSLSKAGDKAARLNAEMITKDITTFYQSTGDQGNAFFLRFIGFSEDEEDNILEALENLEGFQSQSELKNSHNLLEVEYFSNQDKSRLRRKLKIAAKDKKVRLKSKEISGNRMVFVKP